MKNARAQRAKIIGYAFVERFKTTVEEAITPTNLNWCDWLWFCLLQFQKVVRKFKPGCLAQLSWKYVDDTAVSGIIPKGLSSSAQEYVDSVADWTVDNRFQLNIDKRKEIRIS